MYPDIANWPLVRADQGLRATWPFLNHVLPDSVPEVRGALFSSLGDQSRPFRRRPLLGRQLSVRWIWSCTHPRSGLALSLIAKKPQVKRVYPLPVGYVRFVPLPWYMFSQVRGLEKQLCEPSHIPPPCPGYRRR